MAKGDKKDGKASHGDLFNAAYLEYIEAAGRQGETALRAYVAASRKAWAKSTY